MDQGEVIGPEDSTEFRALEEDVIRTITIFEEKCANLENGMKDYINGIKAFSECQRGFAADLTEFCKGTEHINLGGNRKVKQLIELIENMATVTELLNTKITLSMGRALRSEWLDGVLREGKEARRSVAQTHAEYEEAMRKRPTRSGFAIFHRQDAERNQVDLADLEMAMDDARCQALRAYYNLQGRQMYDFHRIMATSAKHHIDFFEKQAKGFSNSNPIVHDILAEANALEMEKSNRELEVETKIRTRKLIIEIDRPDEPPRPHDTTNNSQGSEGDVTEGSVIDNNAQVVKDGYLSKRTSRGLRSGRYEQRFFKLDVNGYLSYINEERSGRDSAAMHMKTATVKREGDEQDKARGLRFCFQVVSPNRRLHLQASSSEEMQSWVNVLEEMIHKLLSNQSDTSSQPGRPTIDRPQDGPNPSHQRQPSESQRVLPPSRWDAVSLDYKSPSLEAQVKPNRPPAVVEAIKRREGNQMCADCASRNPEWASTNLGVLVCTNCSGVHRNLSTDVSKIHSLTLDTKVWERPGIEKMMTALGNNAVNAVWEKNLRGQAKPNFASDITERQKFIEAKYRDRKFVESKHEDQLHLDLIRSLRGGNLWKTMETVAKGGVTNASLRLQFADLIMQEANAEFPPSKANNETLYSGSFNLSSDNDTKLIFAACLRAGPEVFEFMFQNGADINSRDGQGRTPLHYVVIFGRTEIVQYLLKRGADKSLKDMDELTAYDVAVKKNSLESGLRQQLQP